MDKRKALKLEYKQTPRPMGVYQVKNNVNGKVFVGSSPNVDGKINGTKFQLEMGSHKNKDLQNEWNTYGEQTFSFEVLELLEPDEDPSYDHSDDLEVLEELWLEKLQPYGEKGYNKIKR